MKTENQKLYHCWNCHNEVDEPDSQYECNGSKYWNCVCGVRNIIAQK